jgi:hypothetical protein
MTIQQRLSRAGFVPGQSGNYHNKFDCFGWVIEQTVLPAGNSLIVVARADIPRAKAPALTFYVGGHATVTNNLTGTYPDRVSGMFTGNRPDHPAGITTLTAVEELELWCFHWLINKRSLPIVSTFALQTNETVTTVTGQRIFICKGELGNYFAGDQFVSDGTTLTAACATYGFYVENERV